PSHLRAAMGRATGCSGRWENHFDFQSVGLSFSCPALVTDKGKRVEPVPGSKGIKKAPASFPRGFKETAQIWGGFPGCSDVIPKHRSHKSDQVIVQKKQVVVQKMQVKPSSSFPHHWPRVRSGARLYSRPGNDLTYRFPLIVDALSRLRSCSCIIDGEAVAC